MQNWLNSSSKVLLTHKYSCIPVLSELYTEIQLESGSTQISDLRLISDAFNSINFVHILQIIFSKMYLEQ